MAGSSSSSSSRLSPHAPPFTSGRSSPGPSMWSARSDLPLNLDAYDNNQFNKRESSPWPDAYQHPPKGWQEQNFNYAPGEKFFGNFDEFKGRKSSKISPISRGASLVSPSAPIEGSHPYSSQMVLSELSQKFDSGSFSGEYVGGTAKNYDPQNFHSGTSYSIDIFSSNRENPGRSQGEFLQQISSDKNSIRNEGSNKSLIFQSKEDSPRVKIAESIHGSPSRNAKTPINDSGNLISVDPSVHYYNSVVADSESCTHENVTSSGFEEQLAIDSPCWKGISTYGCMSPTGDDASSKIFDSILQRSLDCTVFDRSLNDEVVTASKFQSLNGTPKQSSDAFSFHNLDDYMQVGPSHTNRVDEKLESPEAAYPATTRESTRLIDTQLLVKTIHNLSSVLLETCHLDGDALKINDKEALHSAVHNLGICIQKTNELDQARPDAPRPSECSSHADMLTPFMQKDIKGKKADDQDESSQNTWSEVEAAVDLLKHKLAALRSDLDHKTSKGQEGILIHRKENKPVDPPLTSLDVDPAVMTRFRLIKDRMQRRDC